MSLLAPTRTTMASLQRESTRFFTSSEIMVIQTAIQFAMDRHNDILANRNFSQLTDDELDNAIEHRVLIINHFPEKHARVWETLAIHGFRLSKTMNNNTIFLDYEHTPMECIVAPQMNITGESFAKTMRAWRRECTDFIDFATFRQSRVNGYRTAYRALLSNAPRLLDYIACDNRRHRLSDLSGIDVDTLSDPDKTTCIKYGAWYDTSAYGPYHEFFGPHGKCYILDTVIGPNKYDTFQPTIREDIGEERLARIQKLIDDPSARTDVQPDMLDIALLYTHGYAKDGNLFSPSDLAYPTDNSINCQNVVRVDQRLLTRGIDARIGLCERSPAIQTEFKDYLGMLSKVERVYAHHTIQEYRFKVHWHYTELRMALAELYGDKAELLACENENRVLIVLYK
jgi:hypothetical protein